MSECCGALPCAPFLQSHLPKRAVPQEEASLIRKVTSSDGDDIFAAAGITLPAMYATPFRRWVCLIVFSFVSAAASGPMTMFPTLEPIFVSEKVFEGPNQLGHLTSVYSITLGVLMTSFLPVGIIYDCYGPRWCSVVGSLLFAVFSVGIGLAIQHESLNWMLYFMYPIALLFGYGKNYGAYGYQWLLPESQNTVNSIIVATQALSDSLVVVCVWLHSAYGMTLWTYFYALSVFAVVTGLICSIIVPSRKQHFTYAEAVITSMTMAAVTEPGYGSSGNIEANTGRVESSVKTSGWRWFDNVKGVLHIARRFPVEHTLFISGCCMAYMFTWYPTMQMFPYYLGLFGEERATFLVNRFAVIYGVLGALATVMVGRIFDRIGLTKALMLNNLLSVATLIAFVIPTIPSQLVFQVLLTLILSFFQVFCYRFCMLYGPPEMFGTYTGVILSCMGIFQVSSTALLSTIMSRVDAVRYETVFVQSMTGLFGGLSIGIWACLIVYWGWYPHPEAGSVSRNDAGLPEESEYTADGKVDNSDPWL